ncbi:MAG: hypothetical protein IJM15_00780 [Erysipelotrichaceae bacterium]|nr:hypothetical protein [Erysipelotrichaceae bacterium]
MKKIIILMLLISLLALSGCRKEYEETVNEDQILIVLNIKAEDIHLIVFAYSLDGEPMGIRESGHVDGSAIEGKFFEYMEKEDFPENASLENFAFSVGFSDDVGDSIMNENHHGRNGTTEESEAFKLEYGKIYHFDVTGSYDDGFILTATD